MKKMSIEKKSLISTLKTTKKANVANSELNAKPSNVSSKRLVVESTRKHVQANRAPVVALRRTMTPKRMPA
jgi:hypothetical protein